MMFLRRTTIVLAAALLAAAVTNVSAQSDYSKRKASRSLTVGLGFAGGASLDTHEPPEGTNVSPIFAWRGTVDATYPLTPVISTTLSFGLDSRGTKYYADADDEVYNVGRFTYFTLTPAFRFSAFYLGLNLGFPMSGTSTVKQGSNASEQTADVSDATMEFYQTMIEPRIGAIIPLMDEESGWLGLTIIGGYQVNEIIEKAENHYASLHLGLTWQFAIPGTKTK
jgi:hypothetical protein